MRTVYQDFLQEHQLETRLLEDTISRNINDLFDSFFKRMLT